MPTPCSRPAWAIVRCSEEHERKAAFFMYGASGLDEPQRAAPEREGSAKILYAHHGVEELHGANIVPVLRFVS